jgi:hypothetical protein
MTTHSRVTGPSSILALVGLLVALSGCEPVKSARPFYRAADVQFDVALIGDWQWTDPKEPKPKEGEAVSVLHFEKETENSYTVRFTAHGEKDQEKWKPKEVTWTFEGHTFRCAGRVFLDLKIENELVTFSGEEFSFTDDDLGFLMWGTHTVYRLTRNADELRLARLDDDAVEKFLGKKKKGIAVDLDSHILLIGEPELLQKRILERAEADHLLGHDIIFTRIKK